MAMNQRHKLGEMLLAAGLIREEELEKALHLQAGGTRRIGYLLIRMGFISEEDLQATLAEQLGIPLVDCAEAFNPSARKILPRYLCTRYNVLPLSLEENNVLRIAMVDPSDAEAIREIEKYSGKVLDPVLASQSDISASIRSRIPWTLKEIFNRGNTTWISIIIAGLALSLIAITILQYNHDKFRSRYGTITRQGSTVIYQNHELTLEFKPSGQVSLQGHGAYASGSYSIIFNDIKSLQKFIHRRQEDFSTDQLTWLSWAIRDNDTSRQRLPATGT